MTYRQTFVAEYERSEDSPVVRAYMECMGGRLVATQFSDALEELSRIREAAQELIEDEAMHDECDDEDCLWCKLRKALGTQP